MTTLRCDVAVIGAGPAGAAAAVEARARGLAVVLVDEAEAAGGQVYRLAPGIAPTDAAGHDADAARRTGDALRAELAAAAVTCWFGARVWQVERDAQAFRVLAVDAEGPRELEARALIVASGAQERHLPVPGWERPGVLGLAAATVLMKAQRMLPGRRVVVAGAGPLLLAVAAGILKGGGEVAAVVDAQPRRAWLADPGALAARPDLVAQGARWLGALLARRVPLFHAARLQRIDGNPAVTHVEIAAHDTRGSAPATTARVACDCVCMGFGLVPATDITRLLGAAHAFDAARGGWHAVTAADGATSVEGLFVCGDAAGIAGAAAAPWSGRLAARGVLRRLGADDAASSAPPAGLTRAHRRAARFGAAMTRVAAVGDDLLAPLPAATLVCLCERVSRGTIDAAIAAGACTLSEVKAATRCGMGPCGGRVCEDAAARLIALATGASREVIGQATGRPPLRPVPLAVAGAFDYDALPIAQPAPL